MAEPVLNEVQRAAVEASDGPILIFAGAGSGKTRVLTHRIAHLLTNRQVSPDAILAVTFTNKAAGELKNRLAQLAGPASSSLTVGTFHAICARFLRRDGPHIGLSRSFTIYDEDDQLAVVREAMKQIDIDEKHFTPRSVLSGISRFKSRMIAPLAIASRAESYWDEVTHRVYARYEEVMRKNSAVDFDDLLLFAVQLFQSREDILRLYQRRYQHILVDEFQDTNAPQYELVKLLGKAHGNVLAVGDDDQSIYSFRGAEVGNILSFERDFPNARVFKLEQNYRSTKFILAAAQAVVERNELRAPKTLWTALGGGEKVRVLEVASEQEEGRYIAREVQRLKAAGEAQPGECAVLFRTNAQSRAVEEAFMHEGLQYRLVGGTRFYDRKEIKDLLAYVRLANNPQDSVALQRVVNVPPRGIGAKTIQELDREAAKRDTSVREILGLSQVLPTLGSRAQRAITDLDGLLTAISARADEAPVTDLLNFIVERSGLGTALLDGTQEGQERYANVQELRTVAQAFAALQPREGLERFLEQVALVSASDQTADNDEAVTLITLHAAKGLEYKVVFLAGLEEGLFPHSRTMDKPKELEEERRLCYVGMTRAMRRLYLIHTAQRTIFGVSRVNDPSRFLSELPEDVIKRESPWSAVRLPSPMGGDDQRWRPSRTATIDSLPRNLPISRGMPERQHPAAARPVVTRPVAVTVPQYTAGARVFHKVFGSGVVVKSEIKNNDEEVQVDFGKSGVRKLIANLAPMEKT